MPNKATKQPDTSPEDAALESRVESIMGNSVEPQSTVEVATTVDEPIDIFKESKADPELSKELAEKFGEDTSEEPVVAEESEAVEDLTDQTESSELIDDEETDKAVKDIIAHEADIVLAAEGNSYSPKSEALKTEETNAAESSQVGKWLWTIVLLMLIGALGVIAIRLIN